MKLSHLLVATLLIVPAAAQAQTRCIDTGIHITCRGNEPASLLRTPDGLGLTGWKNGRPYSYRVMPPDGLTPLPQLPQFPQSQYGYQNPAKGYWQY